MFDTDVRITGKHATKLKYLVDEAKIYKRHIDVYLNGAVFGLLYNQRAQKDNSQDTANILAAVFNNCREDCVFVYRLIMLLDNSNPLTAEQRIDRAFRYDSDPNYADELKGNMELFSSYVLGGIEVLFEKLTDDCVNEEDYAVRVYEEMRDYLEEINGISYEEKLDELMRDI